MKKLKVFVSMPFSGKKFEDLHQERLDLKKLVESYGFEMTEQFIDYQFKEDFESKDYDPKWVVGKDKNWLKQSDVVISDFRSYSLGTDFELILSKEVFNKKVYAVVPEERRFHPWLKFYCGTYYDSVEDALKQIKKDFPNGFVSGKIDKRQYDAIAGEYRLVEETLAQKYIYDENLKKQLLENNVSGKKVIVLHSGSGYRARLAKLMGAEKVLGVDLSFQEMRLAREIEEKENNGIDYLEADPYLNNFINFVPKEYVDETNIVVGYFLLDHSMNWEELNCVITNVSKLLSKNGVFIAMMDNPETVETKNILYGVGIHASADGVIVKEGHPRKISIYQKGKEVIHFHNFLWEKETIRKVLEHNNFSEIAMNNAEVGEIGIRDKGADFWLDYVKSPDQIIISAKK